MPYYKNFQKNSRFLGHSEILIPHVKEVDDWQNVQESVVIMNIKGRVA